MGYGGDPVYHKDVSCPNCHTVFNAAFCNDITAVFCPSCNMECAYEIKIILHGRTELIGGLTPKQTKELFDGQRELRDGILNTEMKKIDEQLVELLEEDEEK